jgi:Ca-activated chloride channel family protein
VVNASFILAQDENELVSEFMLMKNSLKQKLRFIFALASTLLMLCASALAQTPKQEASAPSPSPVKINLIVTDESGHALENVKREDLKIFEDDQPQMITLFEKETVPVSYTLVVDNSGSLRSQMDNVVEAGKTIISANQPGDLTSIVRFVGTAQIDLVQDFTSSSNALTRGLDSMYVEGGQTAVIDALYYSAQRLAQSTQAGGAPHQALILISDGEDRASHYTETALLEKLRELNLQVFAIGMVGELDARKGFIGKGSREKSVQLLEHLTRETGGRVFYPRKPEDLPSIATEISHDLHTQYVIGYNPAPNAKAKPAHKVEIKITDTPERAKRKAIFRPVYPSTNK